MIALAGAHQVIAIGIKFQVAPGVKETENKQRQLGIDKQPAMMDNGPGNPAQQPCHPRIFRESLNLHVPSGNSALE